MFANISRLMPILIAFALLTVGTNYSVRAADVPQPDSPAASVEAPAAPQTPTDGSGLFLEKPISLCKGGMCSDDDQCKLWFGHGWTCDVGPGQGCGFCLWEGDEGRHLRRSSVPLPLKLIF